MTQIIDQDKITDVLKPLDVGAGPKARLEHFSPTEFSPTAKLFQTGYDAVIVADYGCHLAIGFGPAHVGDGDVALLVCDKCVADAKTTGFGGGPITARCGKPARLIEQKPRSEWREPIMTLKVIADTEDVDEWVDALAAVR